MTKIHKTDAMIYHIHYQELVEQGQFDRCDFCFEPIDPVYCKIIDALTSKGIFSGKKMCCFCYNLLHHKYGIVDAFYDRYHNLRIVYSTNINHIYSVVILNFKEEMIEALNLKNLGDNYANSKK